MKPVTFVTSSWLFVFSDEQTAFVGGLQVSDSCRSSFVGCIVDQRRTATCPCVHHYFEDVTTAQVNCQQFSQSISQSKRTCVASQTEHARGRQSTHIRCKRCQEFSHPKHKRITAKVGKSHSVDKLHGMATNSSDNRLCFWYEVFLTLFVRLCFPVF